MIGPARPFRFGVLLSAGFAPHDPLPRDARGWADKVRAVEDLGYSTLTLPDHVGATYAPLIALTAAAAATTRLRLGTMVAAADLRHPVMLAKEAATLADLSGGRFELGIGAGWDVRDYAATGSTFDRPGARIERLMEYLSILRTLWAGAAVDHHGKYLTATVGSAAAARCQASVPLLVAGGGRRMLTLAAERADIVGVNVPIRGGSFTADAVATATRDAMRERIGWIRAAAGPDFPRLELSIVPVTVVTDDRATALSTVAHRFGQTVDQVAASPMFLIGSPPRIRDEVQRLREEYGVSYLVFTGGSQLALGPVVAELSGR